MLPSYVRCQLNYNRLRNGIKWAYVPDWDAYVWEVSLQVERVQYRAPYIIHHSESAQVDS